MIKLLLNFSALLFLTSLAFAGPAVISACASPFVQLSPPGFSLYDFDLLQVYHNELLFLKNRVTEKNRVVAQLKINNILAVREFYKKTDLKLQITPTLKPLQPAQADEILRSIAPHPVVGDKASLLYDPFREIGFCFGRAAYVHIELLRRGINPQHLAKVFVMGGLFVDGIGWDFHVATIAQDAAGVWWAMDSLFKVPLPLEDWMFEVAKWDANQLNPGLRFYFTDPLKFQALKGSYNSDHFNSEIYRKYFKDLTSWYTNGANCLNSKTATNPNLFICQK